MSQTALDVAAIVASELSLRPDGITARKLAGQANLSLPAVSEALATMEAAGSATRSQGEPTGNGRRSADLWYPATPTLTPTEQTIDPASEHPASDVPMPAEPISATPVSGEPGSVAPVSGVPVSGAPLGSADHFKVVMVAGVLGDHPDGATATAIADESGLRAGIVGRVLAAMEIAGAAVRKPAEDESSVEVWLRGEADLTTVDLARASVREVCPHCHRAMPRRSTSTSARGTGDPGNNGDGQPTLRKHELRSIVRDFLRQHPGHEFTAGTIAREINRSSGAISNALAKLVISGEAVLVSETPMKYGAAPATAVATAPESPTAT